MTEFPVLQDEPFLLNRVLGAVYNHYWIEGNQIFTRFENNIFSKNVVFKHCFNGADRLDFEFDLYDFLKAKNYKHIYLYRKEKVNEYLSLALARESSIWSYRNKSGYDKNQTYTVDLKQFGILISRLERNRTRMLDEILIDKKDVIKIAFEDLYDANSCELNKFWFNLFGFLKFDSDLINIFEVDKVLSETNQKSRDYIERIVNLDDVIKLITNLT